jgi:hypothetical protein
MKAARQGERVQFSGSESSTRETVGVGAPTGGLPIGVTWVPGDTSTDRAAAGCPGAVAGASTASGATTGTAMRLNAGSIGGSATAGTARAGEDWSTTTGVVDQTTQAGTAAVRLPTSAMLQGLRHQGRA